MKRSYRKTGAVPSEMKKRSPSPPVVAKPTKKQKQVTLPGAVKRERRRSLSSVSSISSSDLSDYNTYEKRRPPRRISRSRSRSPYRRYEICLFVKFLRKDCERIIFNYNVSKFSELYILCNFKKYILQLCVAYYF